MMGGRIEVRSELRKGSTFTIHLPLKATSALVETSYDLAADLTGKHILVVDDLEINRTILSEQLRNWNATFEVASSALSALAILETATEEHRKFDLVVLDCQMPGTDGFELAKRIRAQPAYAGLPMILLSSVEQTAEVKSQKEFGFAEILMKPARSVVLKSAISGALKIEKKPDPVKKPRSADLSTTDVPTKCMKLLVAEDNKTNQLVVRTMLKQAQVDLKIAQNGVEAKDLYLSFKPDMVLMDMSMPEMDGLQATREIRLIEAEFNLTRCPIIALTANAMKGDRDLCLSAGMNDYLSKPIVKAKLLEALEKWRPESETVSTDVNPGSAQEQETRHVNPTAS